MTEAITHCSEAAMVMDDRWLELLDRRGLVVVTREWIAGVLGERGSADEDEDVVEPERVPTDAVPVPNRSKPPADVVAEALAVAREAREGAQIVRVDPETGMTVPIPTPRSSTPRRTLP